MKASAQPIEERHMLTALGMAGLRSGLKCGNSHFNLIWGNDPHRLEQRGVGALRPQTA